MDKPFRKVFYRSENVTSLELDMPERTTQDFDGPGMHASFVLFYMERFFTKYRNEMRMKKDGIVSAFEGNAKYNYKSS